MIRCAAARHRAAGRDQNIRRLRQADQGDGRQADQSIDQTHDGQIGLRNDGRATAGRSDQETEADDFHETGRRWHPDGHGPAYEVGGQDGRERDVSRHCTKHRVIANRSDDERHEKEKPTTNERPRCVDSSVDDRLNFDQACTRQRPQEKRSDDQRYGGPPHGRGDHHLKPSPPATMSQRPPTGTAPGRFVHDSGLRFRCSIPTLTGSHRRPIIDARGS